MKNSRTSFDSSPLLFWAKRSADPESRGNISNLVLKLIGDPDPGSSGMTKEILFQQALEFENNVVELPVISEFQIFS